MQAMLEGDGTLNAVARLELNKELKVKAQARVFIFSLDLICSDWRQRWTEHDTSRRRLYGARQHSEF